MLMKFFKNHKVVCLFIIGVLLLSLFNTSYSLYNEYKVTQAFDEYNINYDSIIYLADIDATDAESIIFKDENDRYKVLELGRINIFVGGLNTGNNHFEDITDIIESDKLYFHKAEALGRTQWYAIGKGQYEVYDLPNMNIINQISYFEGDDGVVYTKFMFEGVDPDFLDYSKIE